MGAKKVTDIKPGDYVLLDSIIMHRHVSMPWKVSEVVKTRVYLNRSRVDHITKELEVTDQKYIYAKSILYAFDTEDEAMAVFQFARANSDACETALTALRKAHDKTFFDHMAAIGAAS